MLSFSGEAKGAMYHNQTLRIIMCTAQKYNDRANSAPSIEPTVLTMPVGYTTALDGIALTRSLIQPPADFGHYALLITQHLIVSIVPLTHARPDNPFTHRANRQLIEQVILQQADRVMPLTYRAEGADFTAQELREYRRLWESLMLFDTELLDWILLMPDTNMSAAWAEHGDDALDEGVTILLLEQHAL